ncbi:PTS system maltose and glucose-specific IIC component [Breznakia sp. PF5-3]|uniref:PTS transporter subunit EIIC n=1 Tax=unclassified Breznakia TaxID=2623764 RepID=UPI0024071B84|nr:MULTISPECIES: PTS transporter subunit EIIC [unclassified Breznakia]MDF9825487.1 PTS system maltose and glucose-specific IIC component [Breznakia sp. PM6-1]MDF9836333.1 PTS system maltose and glucose-specific IIC component [Breznakia sp. PF5-3]
MKKFQAKLQTFAGAMMVPIILLVLVGFFVGIGSAFTNYILEEGTLLYKLFSMITSLGFMFMNHLQLWFAVAIAFTLAKKEKGWAAFAGLIMLLCFTKGIETWASFEGWNADTTSVEALMQSGYSETSAMNFNALWTNTFGMFTYDMGIFSGLVSGVIAGLLHNRFVDKTLPAMFAFFAGTKFVIIVVSLVSIPLALAFYYIWPFFAGGLQSITSFIGSSGLFGTFIFGTLDKMLLPFGIHHLIAFPIEYSKVGGTMVIDGVTYEGVKNIINGQAASATATGYITRNFTNGRLLFQLAGLPGAAFAMYRCARVENRKKVASLLIPAVFTLAMVGISEPIEYTFLFVAPLLYFLVYAPLCGLCYVLAEIFQISINGTALFFMIPNLFQPQKVHAMHALWLLPLTFAVYYFAFKFMITKFDLKTPGRQESEEDIKLMSKKEYNAIKDGADESLEARIIEALGGADNIDSVTCCATRLRVTMKNDELVASDNMWKEHLEALGVVRGSNSIQVIYGVRVQNLTTKVKDILNID